MLDGAIDKGVVRSSVQGSRPKPYAVTLQVKALSAAASPAPTEPLRPHPSAFWEGGTLPADLFSEVQIPAEPAALLKRLAAFPFWRGSPALAAALEPAYVQASARGLDASMGTRTGG